MKSKIILLLLTFSLLSQTTQAQSLSNYTEGVSKLINWFVNIDKVLTGISDKERVKRIKRRVNVLYEDIQSVTTNKKLLVQYIESYNQDLNSLNRDKVKFKVKKITKEMNLVIDTLKDMKTDLSNSNLTELNEIIRLFRLDFDQKEMYFHTIEKKLKNNSPLTTIVSHASNASEIGEKLVESIESAKKIILDYLNKM